MTDETTIAMEFLKQGPVGLVMLVIAYLGREWLKGIRSSIAEANRRVDGLDMKVETFNTSHELETRALRSEFQHFREEQRIMTERAEVHLQYLQRISKELGMTPIEGIRIGRRPHLGERRGT